MKLNIGGRLFKGKVTVILKHAGIIHSQTDWCSWRVHGHGWDLAVLWNNIFSDCDITKSYPVDYNLICSTEALEHLGMSSFWRPLCFSRAARGSLFVGAWLHGNLYIVHSKGFECAEIWHSFLQSEAANLHLLLYSEMLEMPSLCVSRKICAETHIQPVGFDSQVGSTRKIIMGAGESLNTMILKVITDYKIFLVFSWCKQWLLRRGVRLVAVATLSTICPLTFSFSHHWPQNNRCIFLLRSSLFPTCSFFTSCGEG